MRLDDFAQKHPKEALDAVEACLPRVAGLLERGDLTAAASLLWHELDTAMHEVEVTSDNGG